MKNFITLTVLLSSIQFLIQCSNNLLSQNDIHLNDVSLCFKHQNLLLNNKSSNNFRFKKFTIKNPSVVNINKHYLSLLKSCDTNKNYNVLSTSQNKLDSNLINLPFQFGVELIREIFTEEENKYIIYGIIGYLNINLYEKKFFFKVEIGRCYVYDITNYYSAYGSLGFNYNAVISKHNSLSIDLNLTGYKGLFLPIPSLSIKYMYVFNKYFGITTGFKTIGFRNSFFTVGTQFLTY